MKNKFYSYILIFVALGVLTNLFYKLFATVKFNFVYLKNQVISNLTTSKRTENFSYNPNVISQVLSENSTPTPTYSCTEPTGGCGSGHYWDSSTCACRSSSTCQPPTSGCGSSSYWDSTTCSCNTYCPSPSTGCESNYYWDSASCMCKSYSACPSPSEGCGSNYYWDSGTCSCNPSSESGSSCSPPSSGCPYNYYWDSPSCSCKVYTSTCYEPSAGCGSNYYWDYSSCSCKSYSQTASSCYPPTTGCGMSNYWDSYYCSCKPIASSCYPPSQGCSTGLFWNSFSCSCRENTSYSCSQPTSACGANNYWDQQTCSCKSYLTPATYDRLTFESQDRLNCITSVLNPYEYGRLRYLIPKSKTEEQEIYALGEKAKICWYYYTDQLEKAPTVTEQKISTPLESESCLKKSLGESAYQEINQGRRKPNYKEHLAFENCFGNVKLKEVSYLESSQSISKETNNCLRSVLGSELHNKVNSDNADIPSDLRARVDVCFGAKLHPFKEGRSYKLPDDVKSCLVETVGEQSMQEITHGLRMPTDDEKEKGESCFIKLNATQAKFLPLPAEQIPFLEKNPELISLQGVNQETLKIKNKEIGGGVTFSGNGLPDSTVNIYIFSEPIVVTTKTDVNGNWVYELEEPLEGEKHIAYATTKTSSGKTVRSEVFDFEVSATTIEDFQTLQKESQTLETQKSYIKYIFFFIGFAFVVVLSMQGYHFFKTAKTPPKDQDDKEDLEGDSKGDAGTGSIN